MCGNCLLCGSPLGILLWHKLIGVEILLTIGNMSVEWLFNPTFQWPQFENYLFKHKSKTVDSFVYFSFCDPALFFKDKAIFFKSEKKNEIGEINTPNASMILVLRRKLKLKIKTLLSCCYVNCFITEVKTQNCSEISKWCHQKVVETHGCLFLKYNFISCLHSFFPPEKKILGFLLPPLPPPPPALYISCLKCIDQVCTAVL